MSASIKSYNVSPNATDATEGGGVPIGTIAMWGTNLPPSGYLLCDGSDVSRTTYSDLFSVIGTTFGAGNGSAVPIFSGAVGGGAGLGYTLNFVDNPYIAEGNTFIVDGTGTALDGNTYTAIDPTNSTIITFIGPNVGLINTGGSGTVVRTLPTATTFTLPDFNDRVPRGVDNLATYLAATGGADTTTFTIAADNLPQHTHGVYVPGGNTLSAGSGLRAGTANVDDGTLTITNKTFNNSGAAITNAAITTSTKNKYLGIYFIIHYG